MVSQRESYEDGRASPAGERSTALQGGACKRRERGILTGTCNSRFKDSEEAKNSGGTVNRCRWRGKIVGDRDEGSRDVT